MPLNRLSVGLLNRKRSQKEEPLNIQFPIHTASVQFEEEQVYVNGPYSLLQLHWQLVGVTLQPLA
jgi:hypothetical protein